MKCAMLPGNCKSSTGKKKFNRNNIYFVIVVLQLVKSDGVAWVVWALSVMCDTEVNRVISQPN